ncbi:MAG: phosphate/phosphite/phosphonate ABC transporter substrate-binding protein [Pseudomonadota bacterium]
MSLNKKHLIFQLMLFILLLTNCDKNKNVKKIDLSKREIIKQESKPFNKLEPIKIAIGSMITPKQGYAFYRQLVDYIGEKLERPVKLIERENYKDVNNLVLNKQIDLAFVCGKPYVDGHDEFGMELLVAPQAFGETVYYSYIIVNKNSLIKNFSELKGKSFAFTDPMSNTGKLVPTYMLAKMGQTPKSYFKEFTYTYAHDKSIQAVAEGIIDAAAVDSLIWEYASRKDPKYTSKTRIIKKSDPYGIPPVIIRPNFDKNLKNKLKDLFLNMHNDINGKKILDNMLIDKFVIIEDSAYNSIREMESFIMQKNESSH